MEVPWVTESYYPILGNIIGMGRDPITYFKACQEKYGPIFKISILGSTVVIVCNTSIYKKHNTIGDYMYCEGHTSSYEFLKYAYLDNPYSSDVDMHSEIIRALGRSSTMDQSDHLLRSLQMGSKYLATKINNDIYNKVDHCLDSVCNFSTYVSTLSYYNFEPDVELINEMSKYGNDMSYLAANAFTLPRFVAKMMISPKLTKYQKLVSSKLLPLIQQYRANPNLTQSAILRASIDYVGPVSNCGFSDEEICGIFLCFIYGNIKNAEMGIQSAVTELAIRPQLYARVRDTCDKYLTNNDFNGLINDEFMNNVVWEVARFAPSLFASVRVPSRHSTVGEYAVGDAFIVTSCPYLISHDSNYYTEPDTFNPDRFTTTADKTGEPRNTDHIPIWGSGVHVCSGIQYSIQQMIVGIATIVHNYDVVLPDTILPLNYVTSTTFASRGMKFTLKHK